MDVVKLQSVQIMLERAPRQMIQNLRKIIGQLVLAQFVDLIFKMLASSAHAMTVQFNRLGLRAAQFHAFSTIAHNSVQMVVGIRAP